MRLLSVLALSISAAASPAIAAEVVVFAAASLRGALEPVAELFEQETGNRVTFSYAGSNALARQILQGAPADLFISASPEWMDTVEQGDEIAAGTRKDLLGNQLALVGEGEIGTLGPDTDLAGALGGEKLAMAMVDAVPAGQYGKQALERLGLWESVKDSVVQTDNVRAALTLVAKQEAKLGVVYASDAAADPAVRVVALFPQSSHDPIIYPAALTNSANAAADRAFLDFLSSPAASKLFEAYGFDPLHK